MGNLDADEQAAESQLGADEQAKIDQPLVTDGSGIPQTPSDRIQTGAVDAAEAAEQASLDAGDDFTKPVNEKGQQI